MRGNLQGNMKTEKMVLKEASNVSLPGTPFLGHLPKNQAKVALKEERSFIGEVCHQVFHSVEPFFKNLPKNQAKVVLKVGWSMARDSLHRIMKGKVSEKVMLKEE